MASECTWDFGGQQAPGKIDSWANDVELKPSDSVSNVGRNKTPSRAGSVVPRSRVSGLSGTTVRNDQNPMVRQAPAQTLQVPTGYGPRSEHVLPIPQPLIAPRLPSRIGSVHTISDLGSQHPDRPARLPRIQVENFGGDGDLQVGYRTQPPSSGRSGSSGTGRSTVSRSSNSSRTTVSLSESSLDKLAGKVSQNLASPNNGRLRVERKGSYDEPPLIGPSGKVLREVKMSKSLVNEALSTGRMEIKDKFVGIDVMGKEVFVRRSNGGAKAIVARKKLHRIDEY